MYLARIQRRIEELGCVDADGLQPCSDGEVVALEEALGFRLPAVYRELLLWCGKGLDGGLSSLGILGYEEQVATDFRARFRQTLEEDGQDLRAADRETLIVQCAYNDYFCFIRADEGEDPPVHAYNPDEGGVACCCERFSDYLALLVENGPGPGGWEYPKTEAELGHLPHAIEEISGLLFWGGLRFGAVPERVFDLKELRYLNLVGKGLTELSPRIGELVFLQQLDLARNALTSLPPTLAQLDELLDLDLADNQLTRVADVLTTLPSLQTCRLEGNPLPAGEIDRLRGELPAVEFTFPTT